MNPFIKRLLQRRIARYCLLGGVLASVGLTAAWSSHRSYQLGGGAWIGSGDGLIWNAMWTPIDPAGRTAAFRIHTVSGGESGGTDGVGQAEMFSRNSAKWSMVGYLQAPGYPTAIQQIRIYSGDMTFTSEDSIDLRFSLSIYLPEADVDHDGLPDAGAVPLMTIPGFKATAKRVVP